MARRKKKVERPAADESPVVGDQTGMEPPAAEPPTPAEKPAETYHDHMEQWESKREAEEQSKAVHERPEYKEFKKHPKFDKFKKGDK